MIGRAMRVFFSNLGCKLNQAELERAARQFTAAGHQVVGALEEAELHVVNTCTVTHVAARTSRKVARRSQRRNPGIKTVLTGCWVAESPDAAADLEGVDLVVGNHEKDHLVERVHERFPDHRPTPIAEDLPYAPLAWGHARAAVKIEDGCNVGCTFCVIPNTRGRQQSRTPEEVLAEIRGLVESGVEEVVLTGVQISHYRSAGTDLFELARRILEETELPRLRLTSVAPWRFDRRLLGLFESERVCRHFHLSLQSGCGAILSRMRRPYTPEQYRRLVEEIRGAVPGVALTTDVIAGFPGETEAEFREGLDFVASIRFAKIHAFPYSSRRGTVAADLPDQVDPTVKRERMAQLLSLARHGEQSFWRENLGKRLRVLWERRRPLGGSAKGWEWVGTTDNYIHVAASGEPSGRDLTGRLAPAVLHSIENNGVRARWPLAVVR